MKKVLTKILCPHRIIGFIIFNLSFIALILVFVFELEETLLAYFTYALSFYSLVIFCIWFIKLCQQIKDKIQRSDRYKRYKENPHQFEKKMIVVSLSFNFILGLGKLTIGCIYNSSWAIIFASYYLLLFFTKMIIVRFFNEKEKEYKKIQMTGIVLFVLDFILICMILLMILFDRSVQYNGLLIYAMATYDFYLLIRGIIKLIHSRKLNQPITIASKALNLTVAMISMISLATAMITQFGSNEGIFRDVMIGISGAVVFIVNLGISIFLLIKSNKLKNISCKEVNAIID